MSLINNLIDKFKPKEREDNTDPFFDALISMTSDDNSLYIGSGALKNSDIFSAIRKIAGDIADTPLLYDDKSSQLGIKLDTLLNKAPNSNMNAWSFWFSIMSSCLLNGNSYARIERNSSNQITSIKVMPNNEVKVTINDAGALTYYYKDKYKMSSSEVLHFKIFTKDGITGISPLYSLKNQIRIQDHKNKAMTKFLKSGLYGKTVLKMSQANLDGKAKENIRNKWTDANNADSGTVVVMSEGEDLTNIPLDTSVLQIANSMPWTTREIASAFGLPPDVLGVENEHSNNTQSMLNYLQSTLTYYFRCITSELDAKLATGTHKFSFDTSSLFTADPQAQFSMYEDAINAGLLTINEARQKLGLPPLPDRELIKKKGKNIEQ